MRARIQVLAAMLLLAGLVVGLYWPVRGFDFITYFDDQGYITQNSWVRAGLTWGGVAWAFTTTRIGNWIPLTWLSHMAVVQFGGLAPGSHHLVNLFLHALNVLLFFLLAVRLAMKGCAVRGLAGSTGQALLAAGLFAVHPMHIESVAWVAERKDVLFEAFFLLALLAYVAHARRPSWRRYLPALALFIISLLAKPMAISLPILLWIIDWGWLRRSDSQPEGGRELEPTFPLGRWMEKTPFFAIAATYGAWTLYSQTKVGVVVGHYPFALRLENALVAIVAYLGKFFLPLDLAVFYPHPAALAAWRWMSGALLLVLVSIGALLLRKRVPDLAAGWLWFLVTLFPVIGLIQVGDQSMADRYAYLPFLGLYLPLARLAREVARRGRVARTGTVAISLLVLILLGILTRRQLTYWRTSETIFSRALVVTGDNWMAHKVLGDIAGAGGRRTEAMAHYQAVLRINPEAEGVHYSLGDLYSATGAYVQAVDSYRAAIRLRPGFAAARNNLALALGGLGRDGDALREMEEAVGLEPRNTAFRLNLGLIAERMGRKREAEAAYREVLRIDPGVAEASISLGVLLAGEGRLAEARDTFAAGLQAHPGDRELEHDLLRAEKLLAGK